MQAGSKIGRYEIRSKIGSGGMGEVYLAKDTELDRLVALKVLRAATAKGEDTARRFVQEAKAASALNHPNILTVHEIGNFGDSRFIATEYIKGQTLRKRLNPSPLTLREALDVILQVAAALDAAHNAGIVHRDIKPENIMIRDDGLVKVLDFGLAKLTEKYSAAADPNDATQFDTKPGLVMGTPNYMSPQQARGREVDARTDIWGSGVVLYEMISRRTPFAGETMPDTIAALLTKEPAPLDDSVPAELRRIINKSLQKKLDERYQTVKDFLIDLKNLKRDLELSKEIEHSYIPAFTAMHGAAISTQHSLGPRPSSAEYVVSGIRDHKFAVIATIAVLLLGFAGWGYWYLFRSAALSIRSIAVLPFANVGNDPNNEFLSDGLSESLINNLSQLPQLKVIARTSAFQYKGKEIDPQEVAKALGVQAIVTGRVTQRGDILNISVEMINAADKTQMWGETYTRKSADAQSVQEEIARTVSGKLRLKLSGEQEQQLAKQATQDPKAYELYLNGLFHYRKAGAKNVRKALDYYNQALAQDPNFALAHVGAAEAYSFLGRSGILDPPEPKAKAKAAVQKALELDESLAEAHAVLAGIKKDEWEWAGAELEFKRAIELNPSLARAHLNYGRYLNLLGRQPAALVEINRAQELDPLDPVSKRAEGEVLYNARRYDEAIQQFQNTLKTDPDNAFTLSNLGYLYAAKGEYAEAIKNYRKYIEIEGEDSSIRCYLGSALAKSGQRSEALVLLDKLKTTEDPVSPAELAVLYAGLDDKEQAFASLEKAYAEHDLQLQFLKVDPHYDSLRADPRFTDLMHRVGLPG